MHYSYTAIRLVLMIVWYCFGGGGVENNKILWAVRVHPSLLAMATELYFTDTS